MSTKSSTETEILSNGKRPEGWRMVQFGDVVRDVKESERNPLKAGLKRYIGLEHIEPENLHIKEWGDLTQDEVSFTKRFRKGQVLFGKRRAYQRKVAVAEFDGICSSDILTFEPKDESLLPELLPFVVQSDSFFNHALDTSSGSLSPRTRWSQLKDFEFPIPPIGEQRRIVALLREATQAVHSLENALYEARRCEKIIFGSCLARLSRNHAKTVPLESIVRRFIDYRGKSPTKTDEGIPLLTAKNVRDGYIDQEPREYINTESYDEWMRRGIPQECDILFTTEAPLGFVARVPAQKFALAQRIICLSPDLEVVDPSFLFWGLRSSEFQRRVLARATGTTVFGIKQANLRKIAFPLPSRDSQVEIAAICDSLSDGLALIELHLKRASNMRKLLLNRLLSR